MGKGLAFILVAVGVGLLVYWLAAPHRSAAISPPAGPGVAGVSPGTPAAPLSDKPAPSLPPPASGPIAPPRSLQQKERDEVESRRLPFYAAMRQQAGAVFLAIRPSDDDASTLDLYLRQDNPQQTLALVNQTIHTNAGFYGFRHIRCFAPNPPGEAERFRLDVESSSDDSGNWHTFRK